MFATNHTPRTGTEAVLANCCVTCGGKLSIFTRSWGASICGACDRGTSPAARRQSLAARFSRTPDLTADVLLARPFMSSARWMVGGALLLLAIFFALSIGVRFTLARAEIEASRLETILSFIAASFVANQVVGLSKHPLDAVRWGAFVRVFWSSLGISWLLCICLNLEAAAYQGAMPLAVLVGLGAVAMTDKRRKQWVCEEFNNYLARRSSCGAEGSRPSARKDSFARLEEEYGGAPRQVVEACADAYVRVRFAGPPAPERLWPPKDRPLHPDLGFVYAVAEGYKRTTVVVVPLVDDQELRRRVVTHDGRIAHQGTRRFLEAVIQELMTSGDPVEQQLGEGLADALADGTLNYLEVRAYLTVHAEPGSMIRGREFDLAVDSGARGLTLP